MGATAKLFTHGGSQAVRLPKEFRMPGTEVRVRREGSAVILEPVTMDRAAIEAVFARIDAIRGDDEFLPDMPEDPPLRDDDRDWFAE